MLVHYFYIQRLAQNKADSPQLNQIDVLFVGNKFAHLGVLNKGDCAMAKPGSFLVLVVLQGDQVQRLQFGNAHDFVGRALMQPSLCQSPYLEYTDNQIHPPKHPVKCRLCRLSLHNVVD